MEIYGTDGVLNASSRVEDPPYEVFLRDRATEFRGWSRSQGVYRGSLTPPRPHGDVPNGPWQRAWSTW
jgi:hypothetical protein